MGTDDDRIKIVAGEMIDTEIAKFVKNICSLKHKEVDLMGKKIDKIYTIAIGLLVGLVTTLMAVILK